MALATQAAKTLGRRSIIVAFRLWRCFKQFFLVLAPHHNLWVEKKMPAREAFFKKHVEFQMTGREKKTDLGKPSTSDFLLILQKRVAFRLVFPLKTKVPKIMSRAVPTPNTRCDFRQLGSHRKLSVVDFVMKSMVRCLHSHKPNRKGWFAYKFFLTSNALFWVAMFFGNTGS